MKVSFITTVLNEEKSINAFLDSLLGQTKMPDEVVMVDGGSVDNTLSIISNQISKFKNLKILTKNGNRAAGRNCAIENASGDVILCSDAGCTLDKDWVKNIVQPFVHDKKIDVVAGYYIPVTKTVFEKCLAAYTSVMPDKVDPDNFLPSSRSVAFKKIAWEKVAGYPEYLDTCEDLVFARKLKDKGCVFSFQKDAFVFWPQRKNVIEAFKQFFSYAVGDGTAHYFRSQTPLLFLRYVAGVLLLVFRRLAILGILAVGYGLWAIYKNYRYVRDWRALYILPILQFTADIAVITGTGYGLLKSIFIKYDK